MQAPEPQSADDEVPDPSATEPSMAEPELEVLTGYLADAVADDEVELRESPGAETGGWLVIRREDIVEQITGGDNDPFLLPGESQIRVRHEAIVVFRAKVEVFRVGAVAGAAEREPRIKEQRWPRRL